MKSAEGRVRAFGSWIGGFGKRLAKTGGGIAAFIGADIVAGTMQKVMGWITGGAAAAGESGAALYEMAQRTGMTVEALSALGYAAKRNGTDMEALEGGVRKMQKAIFAAAEGNKEAEEAFAQLGLSIADLKGLSPDQQFAVLADKIAAIRDPAAQAAMTMKIFGKTGTALLPLLQEGSKGMREWSEEAKFLGLTSTEEGAKTSKHWTVASDRMIAVVKKIGSSISSAVYPLLIGWADRMSLLGAKVLQFVKTHQDWIVTVFKVASAALTAGAALMAIGTAARYVANAIGGITRVMGIVGQVLVTPFKLLMVPLQMAGSLILGTFSVLGTLLGALLSPVGLVVAAVVGIGAAFLLLTDTGQQVLGWIGSTMGQLGSFLGGVAGSIAETFSAMWQDLVTTGTETFGALGKAMAGGEIGLAAKVLWSWLKLEWAKGSTWIKEQWNDATSFVSQVWSEAVYSVASIMTTAWAGLQVAWTEIVSGLTSVWTSFTETVGTTWEKTQTWISKRLTDLAETFGIYDKKTANTTREMLERDKNDNVAAIREKAAKKRQEIEADRQKRLAGIETEKSGTQKLLDEDQERTRKKYGLGDPNVNAAAEKAVADARQEWQDALDKANAVEPRKLLDGINNGGKSLFDTEAIDLSSANRKTSVGGTFNAAAAAMMGGPSSALERVAGSSAAIREASNKTVELLKQIRDRDAAWE